MLESHRYCHFNFGGHFILTENFLYPESEEVHKLTAQFFDSMTLTTVMTCDKYVKKLAKIK